MEIDHSEGGAGRLVAKGGSNPGGCTARNKMQNRNRSDQNIAHLKYSLDRMAFFFFFQFLFQMHLSAMNYATERPNT
jgi:hypothetical protein